MVKGSSCKALKQKGQSKLTMQNGGMGERYLKMDAEGGNPVAKAKERPADCGSLPGTIPF